MGVYTVTATVSVSLPAYVTDLSITCNLHWKGTKVRHFILMGTEFDCLDQIKKLKVLLKAKILTTNNN